MTDLWKQRGRRMRQNFLLYLSEVFAGDNSPMEDSGRFAFLWGSFTGTCVIDLGSQINLKNKKKPITLNIKKILANFPVKIASIKNRNFQEFHSSYRDKANLIFWWKLLPPGTFDNRHFKNYWTHHWMNTIWMKAVFKQCGKISPHLACLIYVI